MPNSLASRDRIRPVCFAVGLAILILLCTASRADVLSVLAPDAVVVVGASASPEERQIAQELSDKLRAAGGPSDNLVTDGEIHASLELAGYRHLIPIGTHDDNSVVAKCWGHFAAYPSAPWRDGSAATDTSPAVRARCEAGRVA